MDPKQFIAVLTPPARVHPRELVLDRIAKALCHLSRNRVYSLLHTIRSLTSCGCDSCRSSARNSLHGVDYPALVLSLVFGQQDTGSRILFLVQEYLYRRNVEGTWT